jgi:hypothetical protein
VQLRKARIAGVVCSQHGICLASTLPVACRCYCCCCCCCCCCSRWCCVPLTPRQPPRRSWPCIASAATGHQICSPAAAAAGKETRAAGSSGQHRDVAQHMGGSKQNQPQQQQQQGFQSQPMVMMAWLWMAVTWQQKQQQQWGRKQQQAAVGPLQIGGDEHPSPFEVGYCQYCMSLSVLYVFPCRWLSRQVTRLGREQARPGLAVR